MDKAVKQLLNSLKCPICLSQIDIRDNHYNYSLYVCSGNSDHYTIELHKTKPLIKSENLIFFDPSDLSYRTYYQIHKAYKDTGDLDNCVIFITFQIL